MAAAWGSLLHGVAEALGASEAALRLILSIFIGYPLALFQRYFLFKKEPSHNHLFNTLTGLCIAYFNFGSQMYHSLLCVVLHFLMLRLMGRTITAVLTSFCFQMTYLLCGYYYTATDNYDIKWTMPHCVLTLKLIGLAFDYYDGGKDKQSSLTPEQQRHIVPRAPTFLEVCGFSYYYGGFLVGPQFSMCSYLKLVNGELTDVEGQRPNSIRPAMERLCLGLCTLTIYTVFGPYLPDSYFLSEEYANQPFWYRCVYMTIWGKVMLYKYVTCWLVTEGVCILCGLGYNGKDEQASTSTPMTGLLDMFLNVSASLATKQSLRDLPCFSWQYVSHCHSGKKGDGSGEGQSATYQYMLQSRLVSVPVHCTTNLPLALHGISIGAILPFHLGQMAQGVHIGLFHRPCNIHIAAHCAALSAHYPGAKERQAAEIPLIVLYDCMLLLASTPESSFHACLEDEDEGWETRELFYCLGCFPDDLLELFTFLKPSFSQHSSSLKVAGD
ncbi:lysophospholipid acyltransferase 5 [Pelobates cultripes]|uniref:Lysophospholipid acyltransferase 5 n=1 Tax=Pelobates cultripes TaxID=61616 RepID=A0AAD1TAL9_PELCU|nr:lysophospholipid acyltransferase 5 [Pelobates cultripes]